MNALPPVVLVNAVLFVSKQLNLFPVKGEISTQFSPKQIMTGKVVHNKFCSVPFGQYCQISEEGTPRNSLATQTQGAITIGPSDNVQGGHKFYTLNTARGVVRRDRKALPMPQSVIDCLNAKAQGQPTYLVFTDHHGKAIKEIAVDVGHIEIVDPNVELQERICRRLVSLPKSQECIRIRSLSCLNQMLTSELILTILHLKNCLWLKWNLSKPMMLFVGQPQSVPNQSTTNLP